VGNIFISPDLAIRKVTVWAVLTNAAVIEMQGGYLITSGLKKCILHISGEEF
jgi:hypothetical protein